MLSKWWSNIPNIREAFPVGKKKKKTSILQLDMFSYADIR